MAALPSGNVELTQCNRSARTQQFRMWPASNSSSSTAAAATTSLFEIRDVASGRCLSYDPGSGGSAADANVVVSDDCSKHWNTNPPAAPTSRTEGVPHFRPPSLSTIAMDGRLAHHVGGQWKCLDVNSGGSVSTTTAAGDGGAGPFVFEPAAPAAPTGAGQAYYNTSAPAWGAAVIKEPDGYHMFVTAQAAGSGNDPNSGNSFVHTARIDRAVAAAPTGPYKCVEENVLGIQKGFAGNPQIFRAADGKLLLAVIGVPCAVYASASGTAAGPWTCASPGQTFNNPTLVPRPDGSVVLFWHNTGGWGTAVSGAVAPPSNPSNLTASTRYVAHTNNATVQAIMGGGTFSNQLYAHPCEDPFAWYDAAAKRYRMLLHTFRMGMVCGAGTAAPCGGGAALKGGEPTGAFATSAGDDPFDGWRYIEDHLAYNWSIPTASAAAGGGSSYTLRRRERPFLLFDDDGKVYLFTSASPANLSQQMYAHVQEVVLPPGVGPPHKM